MPEHLVCDYADHPDDAHHHGPGSGRPYECHADVCTLCEYGWPLYVRPAEVQRVPVEQCGTCARLVDAWRRGIAHADYLAAHLRNDHGIGA